jgi:hypothetical protein
MSNAVNVTLGRRYEPDMWDLRKQISLARKNGEALVFVDLSVPISSDVIRLALRSRDLYLIGICNRAGVWFEFADDKPRSDPASSAPPVPLLPGSRWIMVGSRRALYSYGALNLAGLIVAHANRYKEAPNQLIAFFGAWDGKINIDYTRLRIGVITFLICEALRFRSIETIVRAWLIPPDGYLPAFEITRSMLDLANEWSKKAAARDPDVQTWPPGMPDLLVD